MSEAEIYQAQMIAGGNAYIRNLAGAEAAVARGQFNVAKVLRAAAHAQRALAMQAARRLAAETPALRLMAAIADEAAGAADIPGLSPAAQQTLADIAARARASLKYNPDVLEQDVGIIIYGCYNCGALTETESLEVCPHCGALAVELEWFGPFYAETPEHLGRLAPEEIVATMAAIPDQVAAAVAGVDEAALARKPSPDEWSVKEIMAHMFETDYAFIERVRAILDADGVPPLPRTRPPWKLHEGKGYETRSAADLVAQMGHVRAASLMLVQNLAAEDWTRQGTLMGKVSSVLDLGTWVANHDRGHLAQIERLAKDG